MFIIVICGLVIGGLIINNKMDGNITGSTIGSSEGEGNIVLLKTNYGDIKIELYKNKAPITVENFLRYVNENSYDGTIFHRIIDGFMIQGGGFTLEGNEKETHEPIKLESNNGLKNDRGTIAMARTNVPDSATNQFFINLVDNDFLNYSPGNPGYTVFGKVVEGMDVVDKIAKVQTTIKQDMKDWPVEDVVIEKASVL